MSAKKKKKSNNLNKDNKIKNSNNQSNINKTKDNETNKNKLENNNVKNNTNNNNNKTNSNKSNSNKPNNQKKKNNVPNSQKAVSKEDKLSSLKQVKSDKNNNKKENEIQSKEEQLIFKDEKKEIKSDDKKLKTATNKSEVKKEENEIKKEKKVENNVINKINTEEFFEEKKSKKRKLMFILITTLIVLGIILCFSTIFAILGSFKITIARGVSINGIDISNLTYNEAKQKISEVMEIQLMPDIELVYGDYKYTIKISDMGYQYNLADALEKAYNVGRTGNIVENNYTLIKTAIFGEKVFMDVSYDTESLEAIVDIIDTNIPGRVKQYSYYLDSSNLVINPGSDGIQVKTEELKNKIITSIQNRDYNNILDNYDSIKIEIPYEKIVADKIDMAKISQEIYTEPQNAYYVEETETTSFEIYPAVDGISLSISTEEAQNLIDSEEKSEYIIPLNITKAEIQLNDIGIEAFPYKIQTFSTRYDASNHSRSKNLQIAADKINGTVLMPGEIFSFNNVVGERTVAEGYENAKIYSNGQVVDGLAGGICQISSTLYNVVLLSNLEIVERYNHSFTTSYVSAGRDATVVYGIKDFKFKNTRNYPIKIEASVSNGVATFSIYGIKEKDEYTVKIIPKTTQTIPYTTQTIEDSTLEPGTMKVTQAGASGCKVTTYKELYLNGVLISNEILSNDVYQTMTRIVRVGPTISENITQ